VAKQTTSTPRDKATNSDGRAARRAASPVSKTSAEGVARRGPNLVSFFQESRAELRKVTWPTREQAMNLTAAVVAMTIFLAVFLGLIDTILDYVIKPIIGG
jgi:preprotein translocase subunit SecE